MVPWLSLLLGASVGAGINTYLTLLAVGLYARFGDPAPAIEAAIAPFGSLWVLVPAGVMFLVEFLADKIPALDNLWDALHTVVRPLAAVCIAFTLARDVDTALQILAALGGGTLALGAHGFKAGLRGLARLNPEPTTNALSSPVLSLVEDLSVAGLLALVFVAPALALILVAGFVALMLILGPRLLRAARAAFRAGIARLRGGSGGGPAPRPSPSG